MKHEVKFFFAPEKAVQWFYKTAEEADAMVTKSSFREPILLQADELNPISFCLNPYHIIFTVKVDSQEKDVV